MNHSRTLILMLTLAGCAPKQAPEPIRVDARAAYDDQRERAAEEGRSQTLELVRLASMALAVGERDVADNALRRAVGAMQDFRADGQFRAIVGAESAKEWKGEPYEKMMAFLYLGLLLYENGDAGNALAMTKSAILADTGTSLQRYRSDFVPAFVLQGLAYEALGERTNAERSLQHAADALWMRALVDHLSRALDSVSVAGDKTERDRTAEQTARLLLKAGLPAGLTAHPRDPTAAIKGALSQATDLRAFSLDAKRSQWPESLSGMSKGDIKRSLPHLSPLADGWISAYDGLPGDLERSLQADEAFLLSLADDPGALLWIEQGRGPVKVATGEYSHILRILPRAGQTGPPRLEVDGRSVETHYLDSVTYQAQTRGSRVVDGFLKGKAVFKDSAGLLGWVLIQGGEVARAVEDEGSIVSTILYILGAVTWIAGIATNPRADIRQWDLLPDTLWLARADLPPGDHAVRVDGRPYTMQVPDDGRAFGLIPRLPPGGATTFGEPCVKCEVPLAIPAKGGLTLPGQPSPMNPGDTP